MGSKYDHKVKDKKISKEYFINKGYEVLEGPNWFLVKPKQEEIEKETKRQYFSTKNEKICVVCKSKFHFGQSRRDYCICRLFSYCKNCGSLVELDEFKQFSSEIHNLQKIDPPFCNNSCQNTYNIKIHPELKNNVCIHIKFCETCNKNTKHRGNICLICNPKAYGSANPERLKEFNKSDFMRQIVSETRKKDWEDPEYAKKIASNLGDYLGDPDWAREIGVKGREALAKIFDEDPSFGKKITQNAIERLIYLFNNDLEWSNKQRQICAENGKKTIHFALEAIEKLRKTDEEWNKKQTKINIENIKKARLFRLNVLKKLFEENPIKFNNKFIYYNDLQKLKQSDICGSWIIRAKFKAYKGTNRENERFRLGPFKSVKVYDEMNWAARVIKQPKKQNWIITKENPWKYAKWWYISNLYYDFEFELITNENGVTEEESLITEAAYASKYNLFVEFIEDKEGRRIPIIEKHAYWSP